MKHLPLISLLRSLALLIFAGFLAACSTTRTVELDEAGTWSPGESGSGLVQVSGESAEVDQVGPPDRLLAARQDPGIAAPRRDSPDKEAFQRQAMILRLTSLVTPGSVVSADPGSGTARALAPHHNALAGDQPGPFEDAAIVNGARSRLLGMKVVQPNTFNLSSQAGVLKVEMAKTLEIDQAAALFNSLLALEGVREVQLDVNGPFRQG